MNPPTNPVGWFEIHVRDMARARAFYETVLARTMAPLESPDPGMEMVTFGLGVEGPGCTGALVRMEGVEPGGSTLVYFMCDDCAVEAARVEPAGGRVVRPRFAIGPYGFIALCVDTEGNMFGLHSMR